MKVGKNSLLLAIILLVAACLLSNFRSFECFFFADDLLCLDYLYKAFHGHPEIFLQRLHSPWQDPSISLLYRPVCDLLFFFDYAFWQANAPGYHITNFVLHCCATILVFLLVRQLCKKVQSDAATVVGLMSGLVFATYPLHVEPIVWLVCRADLAAAAFVLASLWTVLLYEKRPVWVTGLSLLLYFVALLSKEASACAPAIFFFLFLLFENKSPLPPAEKQINIAPKPWERGLPAGMYEAVKNSLPFLAITICYFLVRFAVLGTILGGYTSSLADELSTDRLDRALDWNAYSMLGLATSIPLFSQDSLEVTSAHILYLILAFLLILRIPLLPWDRKTARLLSFFLAASVCSLLPAVQVLGLSGALTNARVFYLCSAFVIPFFVIAVHPISDEGNSKFTRLLSYSTQVVFVLFSVLFGSISFVTYGPWLKGSQMLLSLQSAVNQEISRLNENQKLVVLNLFSNYNGAHLMYEFKELKALIGPNFFQPDRSHYLMALDEYPDFVSANTQRLRRLLQDPVHYRVCWFNGNEGVLRDATASYAVQNVGRSIAVLSSCQSSDDRDRAYFAELSQACQIDDSGLVQVEIKSLPGQRRIARLCLVPEKVVPDQSDLAQGFLNKKGGTVKNSIATYELRRGIGAAPSKLIYLTMPKEQELISLAQVPGAYCALLQPVLDSVEELDNGNYKSKNSQTVKLALDVSKVPNAQGMVLEKAQPNFMFQFQKAFAREPQEYSRLQKRVRFDNTMATVELSPDELKPGFRHSYRLIALDAKGDYVGYYSDTVSIDLRPAFF